MAEEIQIPECNGDRHADMPEVTNIIDQMDTVKVYEMRECNPVTPSESQEESGVCSEDKTDSLEVNKENTEEEHPAEQDTVAEQDSEEQTSQHSNGGDCKSTLEVEDGNVPAHDSPGPKEINEHEKDQEQDLLIHEDAEPLYESREEEILTETEEENTSIETDNDYGQGSCDEQENGPGQDLVASGNRPDIPRHSYSRYDTVSYRKIRKGNTKQRIDEFESMMN